MDQKTDVPGLYKRSEGVIVNKDNTALKAYKLQKQEKNKILQLEKDVSSMKGDLNEIKELLRKALQQHDR